MGETITIVREFDDDGKLTSETETVVRRERPNVNRIAVGFQVPPKVTAEDET